MTRDINTVAELNDLPVGSIVKAAEYAGAMEKFKHGVGTAWAQAGNHVMHHASRVPLPAILLWPLDN